MTLIQVCIGLGVLLVLVGLWGLDQRSKRRDAEDDLVLARDREDRLHDQTPYPMGERLP